MAMMAQLSRPVVVLLVVLVAAMFVAPRAAEAQQEYCRDTLAGLMKCQDFMHGAGAASSTCCDAYEAAFDADPFCLCYVADGTFARATGKDVDVARALQIPVSCGQVAPPVELCNMQGLVLPPYEPEAATPPSVVAAAPAEGPAPAAQPPSRSGGYDNAPSPSFTTSPPLPPPTSDADPASSMSAMITLIAALVAAMA